VADFGASAMIEARSSPKALASSTAETMAVIEPPSKRGWG
jgi:hypothetical protein